VKNEFFRIIAVTCAALLPEVTALAQSWHQPLAARRSCAVLASWLKRSWGGEVRNLSVLIAIGVGEDGFRQILGVAEGGKEDYEGWRSFIKGLKDRGLKEVRLIISDACAGLPSIPPASPHVVRAARIVEAYYLRHRAPIGSLAKTRAYSEALA
jgi:transposase-like protein